MGIRAAWDALWTPPAAKALPGGNRERPTVVVGGSGWSWGNHRDRWDLAREAGDFRANSVVSLALAWLKLQFAAATLEVGTAKTGAEWEAIDDHPLVKLLRKPNPWQSARTLWDVTVDDARIDGYAYWIKVRDGLGRWVEAWAVPNRQITPEWGGPLQVRGYWYQPPTGPRRWLDRWDVVHFRIGSDPANPAQGCSPLPPQVRNVVALNAGERYTAAVLRRAHAGKVLTPKDGGPAGFGGVEQGSPEEAELIALSHKLGRDLGGEGAGGITTTNLPVDLLDGGMGPEQMALDRILDSPEGKVLAALGLNPHVLALTSSQGTQTYENARTYNRLAWENGVIPLQDAIADALTLQALFTYGDDGRPVPEFEGTPGDALCWWNRAEVAALKEDADQRANRAASLYAGGISTLNESRSLVDLPPVDGPEGDLRYGELTPEQEAAQQAQADAIANGQGDPLALVNGRAGRNGSYVDG